MFNSKEQSLIKCNECYFYNNFGVESSIILASQDGSFEFDNCDIHDNYATSIVSFSI